MPSPRIAHIPFLFIASLTACLISIVGQLRSWPAPQPPPSLTISTDVIAEFSTDFGRLARALPEAVFRPSIPADIAALVWFSYSTSGHHFTIAARGCGHSVRGQSLTLGGVVVDMLSLGRGRSDRINVSASSLYVDAGGEQLWIDVLREALKHGVAPRSWTDYLHLTVGGTLSNAGVSGQTFRHGPQICNVHELDVITGKGEMITCSRTNNSDLFYGVLGGLGQLGIITRARIAVDPAPERVRWVRLIYTDFAAFTGDQELLISMEDGLDYLEGSVVPMDNGPVGNWRSSFFSDEDSARIRRLGAELGGVYCLEGAAYYAGELAWATAWAVDEKLGLMLKQLRYVPGFAFTNDVSYLKFLDRVHEGEMKLRSMGLWEVPHPWLNIFVPKSRIQDLNKGVLKAILQPNNASIGPVLVYPINKNKWDDRMSAMIPDEDMFYSVGFLRSAIAGDWQHLEELNHRTLRFCREQGIKIKQYLPHYVSQADWMQHLGPKWSRLLQLKRTYDPKALLSPGQRIFNTPLCSSNPTPWSKNISILLSI